MFERVNSKIKSQIEKIEDMTGDMDPKTNFALIVIQTELERYKFLVRSYLRARIAKVSQPYPFPFLSRHEKKYEEYLVRDSSYGKDLTFFFSRLINTLFTTYQLRN